MSAVPNIPESLLDSRAEQHDSATELPHHKRSIPAEGAVGVQTKKAKVNGDHTDFRVHDTVVENTRPIKVIVIGAGYSGIYCGIRIPERFKNCELVIYDKNARVGGTWFENRYPGCACDIPSHSYQYSFNPNPDWSALYAPAREIHAYLEGTTKKFSADRFVRLNHEIQECRFDQHQGKWHVKVRGADGNVFEDTSDVLISARGGLNHIAWPKIEGLRSFKGEIMHSAAWNEKYDFSNKRIGVIGSGSSAIQIVPQLQKLSGTQLSCFIRSKTWISPPFGQSIQDQVGMTSTNFTDEQRKRFREDPEHFYKFREMIESDGNSVHAVTIKGTKQQLGAQKVFEDGMRERLKKKPELFDYIKPDFAPGCRRLTPGPGFLEALAEDNVAFIRDPIQRIEEKGVVTADGKLHEIDVLVCATGFHTAAAPPFPVTGINGQTLESRWADRADTYMSVAVDGFPNFFIMLGPNAAIGSGSLTMMIENVGDYIFKCIRKLQKENIKSMAAKPSRVRDFIRYADAYFKRTVFMDECKSWYRVGDKITGLWPGSSMHCMESLRSPRWEDYEYEYIEEEDGMEVNQLAWLGNGWTINETEGRDLAWYIRPEYQHIPKAPHPEEHSFYNMRIYSH